MEFATEEYIKHKQESLQHKLGESADNAKKDNRDDNDGDPGDPQRGGYADVTQSYKNAFDKAHKEAGGDDLSKKLRAAKEKADKNNERKKMIQETCAMGERISQSKSADTGLDFP